jgi:hypothetical protein
MPESALASHAWMPVPATVCNGVNFGGKAVRPAPEACTYSFARPGRGLIIKLEALVQGHRLWPFVATVVGSSEPEEISR